MEGTWAHVCGTEHQSSRAFGTLLNHMGSTCLLVNLTFKQNLTILQKHKTGAWKQLQKWLLKTTLGARSVCCGCLFQWGPLILSRMQRPNALTRCRLANFPELSLLPLASWEGECSAQTWKWLILSLHVRLPVYVLAIYSPLQLMLSVNHLAHAICKLSTVDKPEMAWALLVAALHHGHIFDRLWIRW